MLLFSEYDKSLENIYISQPVVDINLGDTNNYLAVSYTHLPSPRDVEESRMPSSA